MRVADEAQNYILSLLSNISVFTSLLTGTVGVGETSMTDFTENCGKFTL